MCLQSQWRKMLLESWWWSEHKWAVEWGSGVGGCLFPVFQEAIAFDCLQKQEDCTTFNHLLKVVLQMLNLGTKILLPHLSCEELSVSELQKTSPTAQRQYQSVAAIKQNSVFNSFGETKDLLCYSPSLDPCFVPLFSTLQVRIMLSVPLKLKVAFVGFTRHK